MIFFFDDWGSFMKPGLNAASIQRALTSVSLVGALLLGGCASTHGIAPSGNLLQPRDLGLQPAEAAFPSARWWTAFGDPELNRLVESALAGNPDLQIAKARLEQAAAASQSARSALLPKVDAAATSTREQFSRRYIYPPPFGGNWYTDNEARMNGSWELDFFGKNRQALDASIGRAHAAASEEQAARVLLASNVVGAYVDLARLIALERIQTRILHEREHAYALVRERVEAGLDTTVQQRRAHAEIPEARLRQEKLQLQIVQARDRIAALVGAGPRVASKLSPKLFALPAMQLPDVIPAELVGRRADVVAARWNVRAALHGVKAARAAFYPDINLGAFIGFQSLGFSRFLSSGSQVVGVGPAVSLPIFDGGSLRAQLRGRAAQADSAIASYNATLVNAVREAADAIAARRSVEMRARQQRVVLRDARVARRLVAQRYHAGLGNDLDVLTADTRVLQSRLDDVNLRAQILVDNVALIQALGGGFYTGGMPRHASSGQSRIER